MYVKDLFLKQWTVTPNTLEYQFENIFATHVDMLLQFYNIPSAQCLGRRSNCESL